MALFNSKIKVVSVSKNGVVLSGNDEWVEFATSLINDIIFLNGNARRVGFVYLNEILPKYLYKDARKTVLKILG